MKNFKPSIDSISYSVPLELDDFTALSDWDFHSIPSITGIETFDKALEKLGCFSVDYNGHFGAKIYFGLESYDDTQECWRDIEFVFDKYIKIARKWVADGTLS